MDATNNLGVVKDRNVVNLVNDIDSNKKNSPIHHIDNDLNGDRNRNIDNNLEYLRPEQADQYRYTQKLHILQSILGIITFYIIYKKF